MLNAWLNEISNSPCRVYICIVSVYLFSYLSICLSTCLYLDILGGSKVDSAFHFSEVGKMSTRNFWEHSGIK